MNVLTEAALQPAPPLPQVMRARKRSKPSVALSTMLCLCFSAYASITSAKATEVAARAMSRSEGPLWSPQNLHSPPAPICHWSWHAVHSGPECPSRHELLLPIGCNTSSAPPLHTSSFSTGHLSISKLRCFCSDVNQLFTCQYPGLPCTRAKGRSTSSHAMPSPHLTQVRVVALAPSTAYQPTRHTQVSRARFDW
jgi:hypothetical protein